MIGQRIGSVGRIPWGAALFCAAGLGLAAFGYAEHEVNWAVAAVLPLAIGIGAWLGGERHFGAEVMPEGLRLDSGQTIRFDQMRELVPIDLEQRVRSRGAAYAMVLKHAGGTLRIPNRLNVSSQEFADFLATRLPPPEPRTVNPQLNDYLIRQAATFGAEQVWHFAARRDLRKYSNRRKAVAVWLAIALTGVAWLVAAGSLRRDKHEWMGIGVTLAVFGFTFGVALSFPQRSVPAGLKNWQASSLIVGPLGLALVQGPMVGEMRWKELRDIKPRYKRTAFGVDASQMHAGIFLRVEGAEIWIADIYDQPLDVIERRIRQFWRG